MATVRPFAALRPKPELAEKICAPPYDVLSSAEARAMAQDNPLSFLHVSKPEIDLPPATHPAAPDVYAKGKENFSRLLAQGALQRETQPCYYLYRQIMGRHAQVGLVGLADCREYLEGIVKKHELTRPDKEDDRVRHMEALNAQTGPVFLTYPAQPELDRMVAGVTATSVDVDFTASDGVRHTAWSLREPAAIQSVEKAFRSIPHLYIADGHHRSAAAARVFQARHGAGGSGGFLAVIFPHNQMQVLPYNRALKDLNGHSPAALLKRIESVCAVRTPGPAEPGRKHEVGFYSEGSWRQLTFRPERVASVDPAETLDVTLLQQLVLAPLLGIDDPRTSDRIVFVGGIRGIKELEKLVDSGECACAFSLYPTRVEDLMAIADADGLMPPKSTWFEPKLRDAMFCHVLD